MLTTLHMQLRQHAARARRDIHFVIGLGAAGECERGAMLRKVSRRDRDTKARLLLDLGRTDGGLTFGAVARQQVSGGNPKPSACDEGDGSDATYSHRRTSEFVFIASGGESSDRTICSIIGSTRSASNPFSTARRQDNPSASTMSTTAALSTSRSAPASPRSMADRSIAARRFL